MQKREFETEGNLRIIMNMITFDVHGKTETAECVFCVCPPTKTSDFPFFGKDF